MLDCIILFQSLRHQSRKYYEINYVDFYTQNNDVLKLQLVYANLNLVENIK